MKKYILGIVALIITLLGINQYSGGGVGADSVTPIAGQTYTLAGSGVSSSDTSITLSSFTITQTGYEILDADMSETFYLTLEPGSRSRQEIVSCTTVTQNANDTATLSGCERGLSPISPYSSSTDYAFAHSGGSTVIFSNPPQLYAQAAFKDNDETITGSWLFPTPLGDYNAATKSYVDGIVTAGTISNDRLIVAGTAGETLATGTLVYFNGTDQEWYKVDTDDTTTFQDKFIGLTQGNGTNAVAITGGILLKGRHTLSTGLTPGSTYYASTSSGTFSVATSAQPIGVADDTNILYFDPVLIDIPRLGYNNTWTGTNTFSATTTFSEIAITGHASTTIIFYTSSSIWTKKAGLEFIEVIVQGAGGNGRTTKNQGGGAGGYSRGILTATQLSATTSVFVNVGAAGIGSGSTSFGSFISATNGQGNGTPGTGTGGTINITGQTGQLTNTGSAAGGNSMFGFGGRYIPSSGTAIAAGENASGYGAGGGGCSDANDGSPTCTASTDGGLGTQGFVTVIEHY